MANPTGWETSSQDMAVRYGNPTVYNTPTPASYNGAQTYAAIDLIGGIIVHNTGGAGITATLPTAASVAALMNGPRVGDSIYVLIVNGGSTGSITLAAPGDGSMAWDTNQLSGARVIPTQSSKNCIFRMTNSTPGSYAFTVYS